MSIADDAAIALAAAERRLIGCVVAAKEIAAVARNLPADAFSAPEHVTAWEVLTDLADNGDMITPESIGRVARQRGVITRLPGGYQWAADIARDACLPQELPQLVEMVQTEMQKRHLERAAVACQSRIALGAPLGDVLTDLEEAAARARAAITAPGGWAAPLPLVAKVDWEPFPADALPSCIQAAVKEVHAFVQSPISMVAMSALGTASLAVQALVDVQRAEGLKGPVGLFLMCIAPSGERKTTCDNFFSEPIRAHELQEVEKGEPLVADYKADFSAWEAQKRGLLAKIEKSSKEGRSSDAEKAALRDLNQEEPKAPRVPRLMYSDATPEALAWGLAKLWPSGGVMSSEAGSIFGAHGMGKDSIMRNLALLNQLWDGVQIRFDRRTSEGFLVRGARLTIGLQVQEETLREFLRADDGLARGMGFLARMLLAWPESTQGSRPYKEPPTTWPALMKFKNRIAEILAEPVPIDEDGALIPTVLALSPEAKTEWVKFHDGIEAELASRGKFCDVRDVASKTADNAVRLAAIFQVFEHGPAGAVGLEALRSGACVAAWHLHEARRFLGEFAMPKELADAARLDAWLIDYCRREGTRAVPVSAIQKAGPGKLRGKAALEAAMRELEDLGRARLVKQGRCRTCEVNPAMVAVAVPAVSAVPSPVVTAARTATTAAAKPEAQDRQQNPTSADRAREECSHGSP